MMTLLRPTAFYPALLFLLALLSACDGGWSSKTRPLPDSSLGKAYFKFDLAQVQRLRVLRNYEGEKPWSVEVVRDPKAHPFLPQWRIESAPVVLRDRLADDHFVEHLLDTLNTLIPKARAKSGELASFGLSPARGQVEWVVAGTPGVSSVTLGDYVSAKVAFGRFAQLTRGEQQPSGVYEVEGAALRMIDYAQDWTMLRHKTALLWEIDDIDVIELRSSRLERVGLEWDRVRGEKKSPAPGITPLLERLTKQRVLNYLDSDEAQAAARAEIQGIIPFRVTLKTRKDDAQILEIFSTKKKRTLLRNSLRGETLFEAYPGLLQDLKKL